MTEPIATRELFCVSPEGEAFSLFVQLGQPSRVSEQQESEWRCPVTIPFDSAVRDIYGVDSWQALCLAISLVHSLLGDFVRRGGRIYYPGTTDEFPLDDFPTTTGHV